MRREPVRSRGPDHVGRRARRCAAARRGAGWPRRRRRQRRLGDGSACGSRSRVGIALFLLFSVGIDLWTDALWFTSVGFDGVFWTRIAAQAGLFVIGLVVALVVFLGNLWLAGRLSPPPGDGPSGLRTFVDRINDAAQANAGARGEGRPVRTATSGPSSSRPTTCPT